MVDRANALEGYSEDELAEVSAAVNAAQALLDNPQSATATAVVSALLDLSNAMQALNTSASGDALRADVQATIDFINENILTNVDGLRPAKAQALRDAVEAAQTVLADATASDEALTAANEALTKAAQELWEIVAKDELNAMIDAANSYVSGDYTEESLAVLQDAITEAQAVAANDDATTAEVSDAITSLANAIAGLGKRDAGYFRA